MTKWWVSATACLSATWLLAGCADVRQSDLDSWVGQPVAVLETHPAFIAMPVVRTTASDGTAIWNYVNGHSATECSGGGTVFSGNIALHSYNSFTSCMQRFSACNNIFIIRSGRVVQYSPVGSGGARCMTDDRVRPGAAIGGTSI